MIENQYQVEKNDYLSIPSIFNKVPEESVVATVKALEASWEVEVREAVSRHLAISEASFRSKQLNTTLHIYPFLALLPEKILCDLILNEVRL